MELGFDKILDDCLERLRAGESVAACLHRYADYADALRPLLLVAESLQKVPTPQPRPEAVRAGKLAMQNALARKQQAQPQKRPHRPIFSTDIFNSFWVSFASIAVVALMIFTVARTITNPTLANPTPTDQTEINTVTKVATTTPVQLATPPFTRTKILPTATKIVRTELQTTIQPTVITTPVATLLGTTPAIPLLTPLPTMESPSPEIVMTKPSVVVDVLNSTPTAEKSYFLPNLQLQFSTPTVAPLVNTIDSTQIILPVATQNIVVVVTLPFSNDSPPVTETKEKPTEVIPTKIREETPIPTETPPSAEPTLTATATPILSEDPTEAPTVEPTEVATSTPPSASTPIVLPTQLIPAETATITPTAIVRPTDQPTKIATEQPISTSTVMPTNTPDSAESPTLTATITPLPIIPTRTPFATATPIFDPQPTDTPTIEATIILETTPLPTDTPQPTATPTSTSTPSATPTSTSTPSATPTPTITPTQTATPTPTPSPTETNTPRPSPTLDLNLYPTPTMTPTLVILATKTPEATSSPSDNLTPTITLTPIILETITPILLETEVPILATPDTATNPTPTSTASSIPTDEVIETTLTPTPTPNSAEPTSNNDIFESHQLSFATPTDVMISQLIPDWNGNAVGECLINSDPSRLSVVLLQWVLPQLAANSVLVSAEIVLDTHSYSREGTSYPIYAIQQPWEASTINWNIIENTPFWDATTEIGILTIQHDRSAVATFNETGIAIIQNWFNTPTQNFGIVIAGTTDSAEYFTFACSESQTHFSPTLTINYLTPSEDISQTGRSTNFP